MQYFMHASCRLAGWLAGSRVVVQAYSNLTMHKLVAHEAQQG
jgi:hypothetical protein